MFKYTVYYDQFNEVGVTRNSVVLIGETLENVLAKFKTQYPDGYATEVRVNAAPKQTQEPCRPGFIEE